MTCREALKNQHPEYVDDNEYTGGCHRCPHDYGYADIPEWCDCDEKTCRQCWDREIEKEKPHILDSGERREFTTGAVRDIQEGKGRCDLMPLEAIALVYFEKSPNIGRTHVLSDIANFIHNGQTDCLMDALEHFLLDDKPFGDCNWATMFLEVSKHFEEGAKKYGEHNWQKGIPVKCYIDSAVRHYLKWLRGDEDEPHHRAFVWNILCCMWTCIHKPELNDYAKTMGAETCVSCGETIPEGRQVCLDCERGE